MVRVREARFADFLRAFEIGKARLNGSVHSDIVISDAIARKFWIDTMKDPNSKGWVLEIDGMVEGVLLATRGARYFSNETQVSDKLFVVSEAGVGHGYKLFSKFMAWARMSDSILLQTHLSNECQGKLERLYAKLGFKEIGKTFLLEVTK